MSINLSSINTLPIELKRYIFEYVQINKCKNCKLITYFNDFCSNICRYKYNIYNKIFFIYLNLVILFFIININYNN